MAGDAAKVESRNSNRAALTASFLLATWGGPSSGFYILGKRAAVPLFPGSPIRGRSDSDSRVSTLPLGLSRLSVPS